MRGELSIERRQSGVGINPNVSCFRMRRSAVRHDDIQIRLGSYEGRRVSVRGEVKHDEIGKKGVLDLNSDFHE